MMQYTHLDGFSPAFSKLVYGAGNDVLQGDDSAAAAHCLDAAWEAGFRVFDCANAYGNAEKNLGNWLERTGKRDQTILITKGMNCGMNGSSDRYGAQTIHEQVRQSLKRLCTDWIDLYILHRDDESKPVDEIVEALNECADMGQIRAFGGSNWRQSRIKQANEYAEKHGLHGFTAVSPCFSLAEMVRDPWGGSVSISGEANRAFRAWLRETQMPVFNYSPLARGFLSGKFRTDGEKPMEECLWWAPIEEYNCPANLARLRRAEQMAQEKSTTVAALCLAWLFEQGLNIFPIVGPASERNIRTAVSVFDLKLSQAECSYLLNG